MRTLQSDPWEALCAVVLRKLEDSTPISRVFYVPILEKAVLSSGLQGADRNSLTRQAAISASLGVGCLPPCPKQVGSLRHVSLSVPTLFIIK